jgi:polyribonucleotide nucleotidyltransferase
VVSTDQINPPDVVAIVAASAAVTISDIPFAGPVGAVRLGYLDGQFIVNPTYDQIERSRLHIIVAGTLDGITMVEGGPPVSLLSRDYEVLQVVLREVVVVVEVPKTPEVQLTVLVEVVEVELALLLLIQ